MIELDEAVDATTTLSGTVLNEEAEMRLRAFIADVQCACEKYGGSIAPRVTITNGEIKSELVFGVQP